MVSLKSIKPEDFEAILKITGCPETMSMVGKGTIWSREQVAQFIRYATADDGKAVDPSEPKMYKKWAIWLSGQLVGVVSVHPVSYDNIGLFVTIFIGVNHVTSGVGTKAMQKLLEWNSERSTRFNLYADVFVGNAAGNKLMRKVGFQYVGMIKIGRRHYNRYVTV